MTLNGGMSCVKYLLFLFNLLFAVTGLIMLISGIKAAVDSKDFERLSGHFFTTGAGIYITVATLIFLISFFGCCGAVKENRCMIITFSVCLLMIVVAELTVGLMAYGMRKELQTEIKQRLNTTVENYYTTPEDKQILDLVQTDFQCCGVSSYKDFTDRGLAIPSSCCGAQEISDNATVPCTASSTFLHQPGCGDLFVEYFSKMGLVIGGIGIGVAALQLMGVIAACCLARSIRNQYETV